SPLFAFALAPVGAQSLQRDSPSSFSIALGAKEECGPMPIKGNRSMHDLVIRNALIADGLGTPLIEGDLAVRTGRVAAVGRVSGEARETVDAGGNVLAPGVIDVHTHYDAQLTWDPTCSPSPALGVTTVVIG